MDDYTAVHLPIADENCKEEEDPMINQFNATNRVKLKATGAIGGLKPTSRLNDLLQDIN